MAAAPASVKVTDEAYKTKPMVDGAFSFIAGEVSKWTGEIADVTRCIVDASTGSRAVIGRVA